jgi:hypothetical protein
MTTKLALQKIIKGIPHAELENSHKQDSSGKKKFAQEK